MTIVAGSSPAGTPGADIEIGSALIGRLIAAQHPDLADLPVMAVASGWDNAIFRLGDRLAVRAPRRAAAASLAAHEQHWLPRLAGVLPLKVPAPVRIGGPQDDYPWPWSIVPWFEGKTADLRPPGRKQGGVLAHFFEALHRPAPDNAPRNPVRGVPLAERTAVFRRRVARLEARGEPLDPRLAETWAAALAEPIDVAATWIHGDPHPRNVLVTGERISAVLDWGDMAQGDRASDLAAIWMLFSAVETRRQALAACSTVSGATWRRARGWAVFYGVMLLDAGLVDDPRMTAIARRIFARVIAGP